MWKEVHFLELSKACGERYAVEIHAYVTRRPEATTKQPAAVKVQVSGAGQSAMSSPPATCDLSLSLPHPAGTTTLLVIYRRRAGLRH